MLPSVDVPCVYQRDGDRGALHPNGFRRRPRRQSDRRRPHRCRALDWRLSRRCRVQTVVTATELLCGIATELMWTYDFERLYNYVYCCSFAFAFPYHAEYVFLYCFILIYLRILSVYLACLWLFALMALFIDACRLLYVIWRPSMFINVIGSFYGTYTVI